MVLMIPTKVIKAIFQENVFFMEIWVSRCIDQCLAVLPGHGNPYGQFLYYCSIGLMGVVGKVMDSAIIPEKMSSRSALLGGFIDR